MTILELETEPSESALQQRLRQVPLDRRMAVTGSYRPVLGRRLFAYDVWPTRESNLEARGRLTAKLPS
jgi:hypothetical protein